MLDVGKERNIEILREVCGAYEEANGQLLENIRQLTQELADLKGLDAAQIGFDLPPVHFGAPKPAQSKGSQAKEEASRTDAPLKAPRSGHGPTPQANQPIQPLHHLFGRLPECSVCGCTMSRWEEQLEESEEISVVETSYQIFLHRRQKYRCRCNGNVITAPGPPKLIPGGRYSLDFAAHSAIAKFCDHIPLERQVRQMSRQGLTVTSQTLRDQQAALAKHLEPTWEALCDQALAQPVLHVDETGWSRSTTTAERVLRGPVVGRKNFYGNRSRRGAKVAAILYSIVETAKLSGTDPASPLKAAAETAIKRPGAALLPK